METLEAWWKNQKRFWTKARRKTKQSWGSFVEVFDFDLFSSGSSSNANDKASSTHVSSPLKTLFGYSYGEPPVKQKAPARLNKNDVASALCTYVRRDWRFRPTAPPPHWLAHSLDKTRKRNKRIQFPETAIVVLCRQDGSICASENYAAGGLADDELRNLVLAVDVVETEEARDKAITEGLEFVGKRFEVFQFHPPLVYGRTAAPKQDIKDQWGIAVVRHQVSDRDPDILRRDRDRDRERKTVVGEEDGSYDGDGAVDAATCKTAYLAVAYPLPYTSAYILTQAKAFCSKFL